MKKFIAALASSVLLMTAAVAQTLPPPNIAAKSWLLLDATSGQVIASQDPNARIEPASLTKIMTAYVVFEALRDKKIDLNQMVNVSTKAWKVDASSSKMFIDPATPVKINDLLYGLMVQSGNDAAVALSEAVAGDQDAFVVLMNREAERMGLKSTHFANPHGLPSPENYSTAQDLATLARHEIQDYPEFYKIDSVKSFTYNKITQPNRNRLLWLDPTVDGLKTGHTEGAGYCMIASAHRPNGAGERRLIAVVLGTSSDSARTQESQKLLNWGFQNFDTVKLYSKGQAIATPEIWKGTHNTVKIGFPSDVLVTVPKGVAAKMKPVLERKDPLVAPLAEGSRVGVLKMMVDGKPLLEPRAFFWSSRGWPARLVRPLLVGLVMQGVLRPLERSRTDLAHALDRQAHAVGDFHRAFDLVAFKQQHQHQIRRIRPFALEQHVADLVRQMHLVEDDAHGHAHQHVEQRQQADQEQLVALGLRQLVLRHHLQEAGARQRHFQQRLVALAVAAAEAEHRHGQPAIQLVAAQDHERLVQAGDLGHLAVGRRVGPLQHLEGHAGIALGHLDHGRQLGVAAQQVEQFDRGHAALVDLGAGDQERAHEIIAAPRQAHALLVPRLDAVDQQLELGIDRAQLARQRLELGQRVLVQVQHGDVADGQQRRVGRLQRHAVQRDLGAALAQRAHAAGQLVDGQRGLAALDQEDGVRRGHGQVALEHHGVGADRHQRHAALGEAGHVSVHQRLEEQRLGQRRTAGAGRRGEAVAAQAQALVDDFATAQDDVDGRPRHFLRRRLGLSRRLAGGGRRRRGTRLRLFFQK